MEGFQEYISELEKQEELYYKPVVYAPLPTKTPEGLILNHCGKCRFNSIHNGAVGNHRNIHRSPTMFCGVCGCGFNSERGLVLHAKYCNGST